jgi:hypothetical protein
MGEEGGGLRDGGPQFPRIGRGGYEGRGLGGWVERATGGGWGIVGALFCAGLNEPKSHGERRDGGLRGAWGDCAGDRSGELKHSCNVFQPC